MEVHSVTPTLKFINLCPPIPGYEQFFSAYLFSGDKKAIVDIGPTAAIPNLLSSLDELGISYGEIDYIILTHIHIDHAGGIGAAVRHLPNAKVLAHLRTLPHLINPERLWQASRATLGELALRYGSIEPVPEDRIIAAADMMKLDLGKGLVLEIYLTPGHAPHHMSIFDRANGVLVAGEAAGVCVFDTIRVTTPPPFKLEETLASLDRLIALEPKRICYSHFGCYDNAPEKLRHSRQKLLDWYEIIKSAATAGDEPEAIFAMLKEKDRSLDYLNRLNRDQYNREYALLLNSVKGIYNSVRESA